MTKKYLIEFARRIKATVDLANSSQSTVARQNILTLADSECDLVSKVASQFNSNFDEARFRAACGLPK